MAPAMGHRADVRHAPPCRTPEHQQSASGDYTRCPACVYVAWRHSTAFSCPTCVLYTFNICTLALATPPSLSPFMLCRAVLDREVRYEVVVMEALGHSGVVADFGNEEVGRAPVRGIGARLHAVRGDAPGVVGADQNMQHRISIYQLQIWTW